MEEVTSQPAITPEPDVAAMASTLARGMLEQEGTIPPEKPRDDKGKFAKPETPAEQTPEEAPAEEVEETPEEPETPVEIRKHKLTVKAEDGADLEVEVDDEELKKGYMLEKSYRQKTAQLAREKEAVQAKIKEATEAKAKEYEEKLTLAEQAIWGTLMPEMQSIDWNKLAAENPAEWAQKYQHVQNVNAKLAQIQQEKQKLATAREEEMRVNLRKQAEEAVEVLKTEIPGWSNEKYGQILKTGQEYGFKAEEVNAITDPRAIKVLHDAMQYRAAKAKPIVEKRAAPQAPKVVKPGAGEKPNASAESWDKGMAKLKQSGRTEDAVLLAKQWLAKQK